jgi:predicted SAM-dependent methyltransferase
MSEQGLKINIGAGESRVAGYINIDYDPKTNPDYVVDLEKDRLPFEDNSVEVILAHHVLEHIGEGYFHCIKEMYRVCKHGAIIDIQVPHHRSDDFFSDPTHRRPITVDGLRLFSRKYNQLCREQQCHASKLAEYLEIDLEVVEFTQRPRSEVIPRFTGRQKEEVEQYFHEHCNILDEVHVRMVVLKDAV